MGEPQRARPAVAAAENGARWWDLAARTQRAMRGGLVDHSDFYALAGEVVATLRALEELGAALARQVAGYGEGRALRDDTGAGPDARLTEAVAHAEALRTALSGAGREANALWSAVGHLGLQYGPDAEDDPGATDDVSDFSPEGGRP